MTLPASPFGYDLPDNPSPSPVVSCCVVPPPSPETEFRGSGACCAPSPFAPYQAPGLNRDIEERPRDVAQAPQDAPAAEALADGLFEVLRLTRRGLVNGVSGDPDQAVRVLVLEALHDRASDVATRVRTLEREWPERERLVRENEQEAARKLRRGEADVALNKLFDLIPVPHTLELEVRRKPVEPGQHWWPEVLERVLMAHRTLLNKAVNEEAGRLIAHGVATSNPVAWIERLGALLKNANLEARKLKRQLSATAKARDLAGKLLNRHEAKAKETISQLEKKLAIAMAEVLVLTKERDHAREQLASVKVPGERRSPVD